LVWVGIVCNIPTQWVTLILNTGVHVAMYYYYLITTVGGDIWWKKYLTTIQIVQFVIDLIMMNTWWIYRYSTNCSGDKFGIIFGDLIIGSFLILFINFFNETYKKSKN